MASAADWSVQSAAQIYAQAESNPQLLADKGGAALAGVVDASFDILRRTQLLTLDLNAHGSTHRYDNDAGLDRDDQQLALAISQMGERYVLQGNASFTRDTTLTSELGTTGITDFNQKHRSRSLSLAPQWQLNERFATGVSLGWQDSTYAKGPQNGLSDYNYLHAGMNGSFQFSVLTSASLSLDAGRLNSALYTFDTDNVNMQLQIQHALSERWKLSLAGGPSLVRTDGHGSRGSIFNVATSYAGETLSFDASLARTIAPNGSGLQSRRDEVGLHASAALREHVTIMANVSLIHSRDLVPRFDFTVSDVRYTRAELSLSWAFAREWNLGFAAGSSEQELLNANQRGRGVDARMLLSWRRHANQG